MYIWQFEVKFVPKNIKLKEDADQQVWAEGQKFSFPCNRTKMALFSYGRRALLSDLESSENESYINIDKYLQQLNNS